MFRALVFLALLAIASPVRAQVRCPAMDGADPSLAERTPEERIQFLLGRMRSVEEDARTWTSLFALGYLGLAAGQLGALSASDDPGQRADLAIGAATSMIGVASLFVLPIRSLVDRESIEALALAASRGDCAALARAERIFAGDADSETFSVSWVMHVGSALFNIGIGLLQGLLYGRWMSGAISTAIGIAVGELSLLTKPTGLVSGLERYRSGDFDAPQISLEVTSQSGQISIGTSF